MVRSMRNLLLRQALVLPLAGMLIPMIMGFFLPGYSSIHQHMSELELQSPVVASVCRAGAFISGVSIMGFAVALVVATQRRMPFTAIMAFIFGVSMVSNGVFTMGSPLHGLYAIGLSVILVPALFAAEGNRPIERTSLVISSLVLIYMWALMTGLDPAITRGLTQRLITIPMFGWFCYASFRLLTDERQSAVPESVMA
jgi:Protein of unknown function (DUF998)